MTAGGGISYSEESPVRPAAIGAEIALGGSVRVLPNRRAGLAGFSAGLVRAVPQGPRMHQDGSLRPIQDGIGLAEDVWAARALLLGRDLPP